MIKIRINFIVTAVWMAMVALLLIQVFQTLQLYDRKSDDFKAKLSTVLDRISMRHEKYEDIRRYADLMDKDVSIEYKDILKEEFQTLFEVKESISMHDTVLFEKGNSENYLVLRGTTFDSVTGLRTTQDVLARDVRQIKQLFEGTKKIKSNSKDSYNLDQRVMHKLVKKAQYVNDMMLETFRDNVYMEPHNRIHVEMLDSIIQNELKVDKLPEDYHFVVTEDNNDIVTFSKKSSNYDIKTDTNKASKIELFPNKILEDKLILHVFFPKSKGYVWKSMGSLLISSMLLMILIIFTITYMFRTILSQKKLSEIKNDFISNMTHEFKTPISTISLACEAMNDKDVIGEVKENAAPFIQMISDENKRLSNLVEAILQSAVIDRGELKIRQESLSLNTIVKDVAKSASFRIASMNGTIQLDLPKDEIIILADKLHTTNLVNNLIDNAIKYSKKDIDIRVKLEEIDNRIELSVSDKGIGIKREHVGKIFDKLYRVPTGNVHNVKGFGLGLSYVKAIADRFGWSLHVQSQYNVGSTFKVILKK